jgi:pilus assembly protein CpaC
MKRLSRNSLTRSLSRWHNARVSTTIAILALTAASLFAQTAEEMRLTVGKSIVMDYPSDIRQISTSDPTVVDAVAVSTREVLLNAKAAGSATVIIWSREGQRTIYSITVEQNLESLRRLLKDTFPTESIAVQSTKDSIALTGNVSTREMADRAVAMVTPFGRSIVNNLKVAPMPVDKQVLLKVRFAELDRNTSSSFGVNIFSNGAAGTIGRITTGQFGAPSPSGIGGGDNSFTLSDALNVFAFRPDLNLGAVIRALQSEGVLQILAEPNLVTTTGKEASFLVGGEFPVPILQGGGNAGAVTVQFREFGIRLTFNPVVTENGTIKMYVKPEVSTIDLANAVTVSGFLIPALATRRMETNVELGPGQSFVIGGLIDDRVQQSMSKVPGLASIPLLGQIFKSRDERKNRTELIVLVTPEITKPIEAGEPTPGPVMLREFMGPAAPADKRSSETVSDKPVKQAKKDKPEKKAAKGFFARKG